MIFFNDPACMRGTTPHVGLLTQEAALWSLVTKRNHLNI